MIGFLASGRLAFEQHRPGGRVVRDVRDVLEVFRLPSRQRDLRRWLGGAERVDCVTPEVRRLLVDQT